MEGCLLIAELFQVVFLQGAGGASLTLLTI